MSTENTAPAESANETTDGAKPEEVLGESGLAALKSEREARKAAEKSAAEALARVKAFEDAQKTESERQAERLAEIERENAELKTAKTRAEVAAAKGVPVGLLSGTTQEELEASADALIAFKGEPQQQRLHVPQEGSAPELALNGDGIEQSLKHALGIQ